LPGLSPGALCRLHKSIWLEIEVHIDAIKNSSCWRHGEPWSSFRQQRWFNSMNF